MILNICKRFSKHIESAHSNGGSKLFLLLFPFKYTLLCSQVYGSICNCNVRLFTNIITVSVSFTHSGRTKI